MYIHFVGGLAGHKGRNLLPKELIAIKLAKHHYPFARIKIWTDKASWHNAPNWCERHEVAESWYSAWSNFALKAGQHMSDKVRLFALKQFGGLYLDTDVLCLRPINLFGRQKVLMAREGNRSSKKLNNGIIYVPRPNHPFIDIWIQQYTEAKRLGYWEYLSVRKPFELAQQYPELIEFEQYSYKQFHGVGWKGKTYYDENVSLPSYADKAYFWHCLDSSQIEITDINLLGKIFKYAMRCVSSAYFLLGFIFVSFVCTMSEKLNEIKFVLLCRLRCKMVMII